VAALVSAAKDGFLLAAVFVVVGGVGFVREWMPLSLSLHSTQSAHLLGAAQRSA
jgi:hypothetical protein